ncbi:MAG TPA: DUF1992 domain-containing protein [Tepidisphaeraceae bacterium]|nr:DUF1992 domain-containing protein [Tepidisphaeraceae bacterium]
MGLQNVDITSALRRLAEQRIEDAMREGKFDHLEGAGKPLNLEPMPADEDARLRWWALRILRQNGVVPEEVRWRKALDYLRVRLSCLRDESHLESVVEQINELVRKINTLGTNALKGDIVPVDVEVERVRLRARLASL